MLNVDRVYTSKWAPLDTIRDKIDAQMNSILSSLETVTLTTAQKTEIREKLYNSLNTSVTETFAATTPFLDFQERSGIILPDTESCVDIATDIYKTALGDDIDTTSETHVGRMIEQSALFLRGCLGVTAENIMQMDLNVATGRYLDALGEMFFASRKSAKATRVYIAVTNTTESSIIALALSNSFTDANGVRYNLLEDTTCAANETTTLLFECLENGNVIPSAPFTYNLESSNLENPTFMRQELGYDVESDDDFRERLKDVRVSSIGFNESVNASLLAIEGVYEALVLENTTSQAKTIRGVNEVSSHSIAAYVDFDGTESTANEIAEALHLHKSIGCGYSDNSVGSSYYGAKYQKTVRDVTFGLEYQVTFYSPILKPVSVKVEVTRNLYTGVDLAKDVKEAIVAWANGDVPYVDGLTLGYDVKSYEIGAAVSQRIPEIQIDSVLLKFGAGGTPTSARLTVNAYERATIVEDNITVVITG